MRRIAKTDANHREIAQRFRELGASVYSTHQVGRGFPDLVVGFRGRTILIEVKANNLAKLTEDEREFFGYWKGAIERVNSVADCDALAIKWSRR